MLYLITYHLQNPDGTVEEALEALGECRQVHPGCLLLDPRYRLNHIKKLIFPLLGPGDTLLISRMERMTCAGCLPRDLADFAESRIRAPSALEREYPNVILMNSNEVRAQEHMDKRVWPRWHVPTFSFRKKKK